MALNGCPSFIFFLKCVFKNFQFIFPKYYTDIKMGIDMKRNTFQYILWAILSLYLSINSFSANNLIFTAIYDTLKKLAISLIAVSHVLILHS